MKLLSLIVGCITIGAQAHGGMLPVNPELGVPGFPNCKRANPDKNMTVEEAAMDLICFQKEAPEGAIKIGCIGDSITAGVHSSGGIHPYPEQLQILLDGKYGNGTYSTTNLGACGSTMQKAADSPYWKRAQFTTLTSNKWDIITIMLGTNDAKDAGDGHEGADNWIHDCGGPDHTTLSGCRFAQDYAAMFELIRTLGPTPNNPPKIFVMVPPPLMQDKSITANQTVINNVYPKLIPLIHDANKADGLIDVYTGMGGEQNWASDPNWPESCVLKSPWKPCGYWCDAQSCDQCHPNDDGYTHLAGIVLAGLGL